MDAGKTLNRSRTHMPMAIKQAVVIGIVLAAIGYAMAMMGAHSPTSTAEEAAARPVREATVVLRPTPSEDQVQREEDPRACEPGRGITERCVY